MTNLDIDYMRNTITTLGYPETDVNVAIKRLKCMYLYYKFKHPKALFLVWNLLTDVKAVINFESLINMTHMSIDARLNLPLSDQDTSSTGCGFSTPLVKETSVTRVIKSVEKRKLKY